MRKYVLALALSSLVFSTGALAQQLGRGSPAEQRACTRDVQRHCRAVIDQGDFAILACLKEHRAHISGACKRVLKSHNQ
ncbi:MAG: cysteine rich repeat-containing protein [Bradyrhizobium sp.]